MKVKVQQGPYTRRKEAEADDITYIVIFSDDDTPIMALEQVGRDHVQVTKATEPMFAQVLRRLGIDVGRAVAP